MTRTSNITLGARGDFPAEIEETFSVRDGRGRVVENWTYTAVRSKGKRIAIDYAVETIIPRR